MEWTCFEISAPVEKIDAVTDALMLAGIYQFAVADPRDLDEVMAIPGYMDYIGEELGEMQSSPGKVTVYIPSNAQGADMMRAVESAAAAVDGVTCRLEGINEEDWANNWKKYFKPIKVGEKLIIKPSWETVEDAEGRVIVEIDPSSSFGTGTHATTRLCMQALELCSAGEDVLDMGCGSGILGVTAMLMGAKSVVAMDIEENAIDTSRKNAERNGVDAGFEVYRGNALGEESAKAIVTAKKYGIILANIVADVIIMMAPLFAEVKAEGGVLIASGIIDDREEEVIDALNQAGFTVERVLREDGWSMVMAK